MIIEAQDGRYYYNPVLVSDHATLQGGDDGTLCLYMHKDCSVRKACAELGIEIFRASVYPHTLWITWPTGIHMEVGAVAEVQLKGPIPVPQKHNGSTDYCLRGDPLICWSMKFDGEMIFKILQNPETAIKPDQGCKVVYDFLEATPKTIRRKLNKQDCIPDRNGYVTLRRKHAYIC